MGKSSRSVDVPALIRKPLADALERSAKAAGYSIASEYVTCEMGLGFTVLTAPIARDDVPTGNELSRGVDLLYAYVAFREDERLKPGFYVIRIATSGFNFKAGVKVSFVDPGGKTVHALQAKSKALARGKWNESPTFDEFAVRSFTSGERCGRTKCFTWTRKGFLDWEWGCTDKNTGAVVNCV